MYIDLIFILNFLFDLLLLYGLGIILKRQTTFKRLLLGALIGTLFLLIPFLLGNGVISFISKIVTSFVMVIVTFGYKDVIYTLRNVFYLYTISIFLGGSLYLVNTSLVDKNMGLNFYNSNLKINFLFLLVLSPIIVFIYVKGIKKIRNNYNNYYNVDIYITPDKVISLTGFMDSGNNLVDPYKKRPIILVNKKLIDFDYNLKTTLLVPYHSLNSSGLLKCIIPEKMYISEVGVRRGFLIGISEDDIRIDGVDCILHHSLL